MIEEVLDLGRCQLVHGYAVSPVSLEYAVEHLPPATFARGKLLVRLLEHLIALRRLVYLLLILILYPIAEEVWLAEVAVLLAEPLQRERYEGLAGELGEGSLDFAVVYGQPVGVGDVLVVGGGSHHVDALLVYMEGLLGVVDRTMLSIVESRRVEEERGTPRDMASPPSHHTQPWRYHVATDMCSQATNRPEALGFEHFRSGVFDFGPCAARHNDSSTS